MPIVRLAVRRQSPEPNQTACYHYCLDKDEILVGRGELADIRLPHPAVSLVHLRLSRQGEKLFVVDGGSKNGSRLDDRLLEPEVAAELTEGATLLVGPFELRLERCTERRAVTAPSETAIFARRMVADLLGLLESPHPTLEVCRGPDLGSRVVLENIDSPVVVGRAAECALRLSDADVSRRHLELRRTEEGAFVRDLGSKNSFTVNGHQPPEPALLRDGDSIELGRTALLYRDLAEAYLRDLSLPAPPGAEAQPSSSAAWRDSSNASSPPAAVVEAAAVAAVAAAAKPSEAAYAGELAEAGATGPGIEAVSAEIISPARRAAGDGDSPAGGSRPAARATSAHVLAVFAALLVAAATAGLLYLLL